MNWSIQTTKKGNHTYSSFYLSIKRTPNWNNIYVCPGEWFKCMWEKVCYSEVNVKKSEKNRTLFKSIYLCYLNNVCDRLSTSLSDICYLFRTKR